MSLKSYSRARAVHVMLVYTGGCNGCDIEIVNCILSPKYDAEQYKVFLTWNPREADVLVVTGPVTKLNEQPLGKYTKPSQNLKPLWLQAHAHLWVEYTRISTEIYPQKRSWVLLII